MTTTQILNQVLEHPGDSVQGILGGQRSDGNKFISGTGTYQTFE